MSIPPPDPVPRGEPDVEIVRVRTPRSLGSRRPPPIGPKNRPCRPLGVPSVRHPWVDHTVSRTTEYKCVTPWLTSILANGMSSIFPPTPPPTQPAAPARTRAGAARMKADSTPSSQQPTTDSRRMSRAPRAARDGSGEPRQGVHGRRRPRGDVTARAVGRSAVLPEGWREASIPPIRMGRAGAARCGSATHIRPMEGPLATSARSRTGVERWGSRSVAPPSVAAPAR